MVVFTQMQAQDLVKEIKSGVKSVAGLIHSARQKPGHVILMATRENDEALRSSVGWLRHHNYEVTEYRTRDGALAQRAAVGAQSRIMETGLCQFYSNHAPCPFAQKGGCRFRCYDYPSRR